MIDARKGSQLLTRNVKHSRWLPFDPSRNWPDLGPRFIKGERTLREAAAVAKYMEKHPEDLEVDVHEVFNDKDILREVGDEDEQDLSWATVLKRSFEAYLRSERPNMYGEWLRW